MHYKNTENYLCFRGILEEAEKLIRPKIVEILAEFLNQEAGRVEDKIDLVYRIRS